MIRPPPDAPTRALRPGAARRASRGALVAALALVVLACRESVPPEPPPVTGSGLFLRHCASCHGVSGKGDGPLAATLKVAPSDLTTLALRNGGRFDEAAVMAVIDGRRDVAAHGPRDMPVWGAVFSEQVEASGKGWPEYTALLHARSLVDYLASIQER